MGQTLQELLSKLAKNHNFRKRLNEENTKGHKIENDKKGVKTNWELNKQEEMPLRAEERAAQAEGLVDARAWCAGG